MRIFREKEGVISERAVWVCVHRSYLYIGSTFIDLIRTLITQWNDDRHLVG